MATTLAVYVTKASLVSVNHETGESDSSLVATVA